MLQLVVPRDTSQQGLVLLDRLGLLPEAAPRPSRHVPGDICPKCGAWVCAGIRALHRYCPPRPVDDPALSRRPRPLRRRRRLPIDGRRAA